MPRFLLRGGEVWPYCHKPEPMGDSLFRKFTAGGGVPSKDKKKVRPNFKSTQDQTSNINYTLFIKLCKSVINLVDNLLIYGILSSESRGYMQVKVIGFACRLVANQSVADDFLVQGEGNSRDEARRSCLEKTEPRLQYFMNLGDGILIPEELFGRVPNNLPPGHQLLVVERLDYRQKIVQRYYLAVKPGVHLIVERRIKVTMDTPKRISIVFTRRYQLPPDVMEYLGGTWSTCLTLD